MFRGICDVFCFTVGLGVTTSLEKFPTIFLAGKNFRCCKNSSLVCFLVLYPMHLFSGAILIHGSMQHELFTERCKRVVLKGPFLLVFQPQVIWDTCETRLTTYELSLFSDSFLFFFESSLLNRLLSFMRQSNQWLERWEFSFSKLIKHEEHAEIVSHL